MTEKERLMLLPTYEKDFPSHLAIARPYIERCLERSPIPHTFEDVVRVLHTASYQLFLMVDSNGKVKGCTIANVIKQLETDVLNIFLMSHDPDYTEEDSDCELLVEMAKSMGIKYLTYYGRRGFAKRNAPKGWKVSQIIMTKEI